MRTILLLVPLASACTNFIVTKGASLEGHNSFAYTDDGGNNYGEITLLPAADHPAGSTRKIWRWEDGKYLGEIPEAAHTYHVVGNMNEHQLAIGETTFTGRTELRNPMEIAKMDYANLMSISLQRAKTAREAIDLMDQLTKDFGYASTGESLTISDPAEVWHMEIVGRGQEKGAAWVARRVPDGYIGGHANQARITTFPLDEPETTKYSVDLISWARRAGYFAADGPDEAFDFSAAFKPDLVPREPVRRSARVGLLPARRRRLRRAPRAVRPRLRPADAHAAVGEARQARRAQRHVLVDALALRGHAV